MMTMMLTNCSLMHLPSLAKRQGYDTVGITCAQRDNADGKNT